MLPTPEFALMALWVGPTFAAAALGAVSLVSVRVSTTQEAFQLGGLVVIPVVAMLVSQASGAMLLSPWVLVVAGVVAAALAIGAAGAGGGRPVDRATIRSGPRGSDERTTTAPRTRTGRLLFGGAALGATGFFAGVATAPLAAQDLTGGVTWSGVPGAMGIAGTALGATLVSLALRRFGRRPGLSLGYGVGAAGALTAGLALRLGSFPLLLLGAALFGIGNASNQLTRYVVADMHDARPPRARPGVDRVGRDHRRRDRPQPAGTGGARRRGGWACRSWPARTGSPRSSWPRWRSATRSCSAPTPPPWPSSRRTTPDARPPPRPGRRRCGACRPSGWRSPSW